jgi:Fe-coproporphyrin III synthase
MIPHRMLAAVPYIAWTYFLKRAQKPYLASYKLNYRCNLCCQQCPFYNMETQDSTYAQVVDILDRLYRRGNRMVVFEGGEPMLWHEGSFTIHDVVSAAKKRFLCVGMTTNGTFPLDVPVDVLWVSVDGFAQTHNRLRGAPVFDKIMENIRASTHPKLFAHITVNRENAEEVPALVRFLGKLVKGITIQFYYPYYHQDALFLDFKRREKLLEEIICLKVSGEKILNSLPALQAMKRNTWRCSDWLVDCAEPDGSLRQGCYLKGRDDIDCTRCGFSPYTEISLAWRGSLPAILAGETIFFHKFPPSLSSLK